MWSMTKGPFVGSRVELRENGSVKYLPPQETSAIWEGARWRELPESEDDGDLEMGLMSTKSGDRLVFTGTVQDGGMSFIGRVRRDMAERRVSRWNFAQAIVSGGARQSEDIGPFSLIKMDPDHGQAEQQV